MGQHIGYYESGGSRGKQSATADTVIQFVVPARNGCFTRLNKLSYTNQGTAQTFYVMRPLAATTITAAVAIAGTTLTLKRDPGAYAANAVQDGKAVPSVADNLIAANDYVVLQCDDGIQRVIKVTSVSGLVLTVPSLVGGASANARVWFFGAVGDTDPNSGLVHAVFTITVSVTSTYTDSNGEGLICTHNKGEPLVLHSTNETAAGTIEQASWSYTTR